MSGLDRALAAVGLGWHVIPCGIDKRPLTRNWLKDASTSKKAVRAWWAAPHPGPAARSGRPAVAAECGR